MPEQPYPYEDVLTAHAIARARYPELADMDLPAFSRFMNKSLGTTKYSVGEAGPVKSTLMDISLGLDSFLKPLSKPLGEAGASIGSLVGETGERIGRRVGEALPRTATDLGLVIGGLAAGGVPGLLLAGTGAASAGAGTLTQTGSTPAALVSGAATLAAPFAGRLGGQAAVRYLTPQIEKIVGRNLPFLSERLVREAGEQAAFAGFGETTRQASSVVSGQGLAPITPESVGEQVAFNIPFLPFSIPRLAKGYKVSYPRTGPAQAGPAGFKDLFSRGGEFFPTEREARQSAAIANIAPAQAAAEASAAFNPEQLQGPFGLIAREQLGLEKPFGVTRLPGDYLPGNFVLAKMKKMLPEEEWNILRNSNIEGFLKGKRVGIKELDDWIAQNGPRVEVTRLRSGETVRTPQELASERRSEEVAHQLETMGFMVDPITGSINYPESYTVDQIRTALPLMEEHAALREGRKWTHPESANVDAYSDITPHADVDQTAVLIHLPGEAHRGYVAPHFKNLGRNLFGWVRIQYVTDPKGRKSAHLIEVQGDWEQQRVKYEEFAQGHRDEAAKLLSQGGDKNAVNDHLRLAKQFEDAAEGLKTEYGKDYNRILLKAGVDQALKDGAERVVLSDADTAMLTEQHDLQAGRERLYGAHTPKEAVELFKKDFPNAEVAKVYIVESTEDPTSFIFAVQPKRPLIPQEAGMRAHYDEILPNILRKLTGEQGEKVNLGEHQNAFEFEQYGYQAPEGSLIAPAGAPPAVTSVPRKNLVIKNLDGSFKTDVTGLSFDLTKVRKSLAERRGFTLFGRDQITTHLKGFEAEGSSPEAMARSAEALKTLEVRPGETLAQAAAREVGLNEVLTREAPPGEFLLRTQRFFGRYFDLKGEVGPRKEFLVRNSILMAARFEKLLGRTHLAEVLQGPSFYAPGRDSKFNAIIGLRTTKVLKQGEMENLRILWDSAHEMMHGVEQLARPFFNDWTQAPPDLPELGAYIRALEQARTLSVDDKQLVLQTLIRHSIPGASEEFDYKARVLESLGATRDAEKENSEFLADFGGLIALGASSQQAVRTMQDYVFFNDKTTADLTSMMVKDVSQTLSAVRDYLKVQLESSRREGEIGQVLRAVDSIHENLTKILKSDAEAQVAYDSFRGLMDRMMTGPLEAPPQASFQQVQKMFKMIGTPGVWVQKADLPPSAIQEAEEQFIPISATKVGGVRAKWWERFLPMTQFAALFRKEVPEFEQATQVIRDVPAMASQRSYQMWQHFVDANGRWDAKRIERLGNLNNVIAKAFSAIALHQNADSGRRWNRQQIADFVRQRYPSLSEEDVNTLDVSFQQMEMVHKEAAELLHRGMVHSVASRTGLILMQHNPRLSPTDADRLGLELTNAILDPSPLELEQAASMQRLAQRAGSPEAFTAAQNFLAAAIPPIRDANKRLRDRPGYFSEVRPGQWIVAWKDATGQVGLEDFNTQAEAQARLNKLNERVADYQYIRGYNKIDSRERWRGVSKDFVNIFIEADKAVYEAALAGLRAGGADEQLLNNLREQFEPGDGALRIWTPPYMQERQFIAGREKLNMMEQALNYVSAVSYGTSRRFVREKVELIQRHPNLRTNPAMTNSLRRYASEMLDASGPEWQSLKNFLYFNTLGFQLATGLVNTSQNFMVGAPLLVRYGATLGEAYGFMVRASAELGKAHLKNLSIKEPVFSNEEHADVIARGESERVVDKGVVAEYFALDDELGATRRSITTGSGKVSKARALLSNATYHLLKYSRDFFMGYTEQFNQRAGLLAGYDFARQKLHLDQDGAYLWAKQFVQEANFGGGRYNRPEIFNGLGKGFGVAGLAYTLNGYTFNLLGVYARLAKEALGHSVTDQSSSARKALGTMLLSQAMMGGAMGLPMVSGLVAVLEQLFPDLEVKRGIRSLFHTLGGGDDDLGHLMGDIGMGGVLTAATNADVGSRFQLGTFMGVDPYNGFQFQNLTGPTGALFENMIRATQQLSSGEVANATEKVLPSGLRGLWRQVNQEGGLRNSKGQLLFEATPAEQLVSTIGFRPKRLAHYYEQQSMKLRSEEIEQRRLDRVYDKLADQLVAGDAQGVRAGLIAEMTQAQEQGQFFDPRAGLRRVVEVAQARTVPIAGRPSRGARTNVENRTQIASLFPSEGQGSEVSRLMARYAIERSVGLPGAGRPDMGSIREAQMIDQLRAANPRMSVEEAKEMVKRALSRQPVYGPLPRTLP